MAHRIDGKAFAETLRGRVAQVAASFEDKAGRRAGLAVVLVGDDPASHIYVRNKGKQTVECGMNSFEHLLPEATPEAELLALVESSTPIRRSTAFSCNCRCRVTWTSRR